MGTIWGRRKLWRSKTVEGFAACGIGIFLGVFIVSAVMREKMSKGVILAIVLTAMEEVVCEEVDNYVLPMFFLGLLCCVQK